jgi:glycosylphosphatidylinositol transamidase (GPIT) subunit GPI8
MRSRLFFPFFPSILLVPLLILAVSTHVPGDDLTNQVTDLFTNTSGRHTNNWAVLVCASRYWFNYRVRSLHPLNRSALTHTRSIWPTP